MRRRKKNAQIKLAETIAVLFVFFMFIVFGFIFYTRIHQTTYSQDLDEQQELLAIESVQKIAYLPEVQCSSKNVLVDNCYDLLKVEAFAGLMDQPQYKDYYIDQFRFTSVEIKQVYPKNDTNRWVLYNNSLTDSTAIFTPIPISLYNPKTDEYYFGELNIYYYALRLS